VERLIAFWSNHLAISTVGEPLVVALAGSYEREVIRPHVLGRFEDMVRASSQHPAMLVYLDNFQSMGPNAPAARRGRGAGQRGLNENYARELLELHTLGVNGGYEQGDVQELARVLTGWTVRGLAGARLPAGRQRRLGSAPGRAIEFAFEPALHEPGAKTVLGRRYGPGGVDEGERAIRDLCAHAATAELVAGKLVKHFVADDPPVATVARIARVFLDSGGDLRQVSLALVDLDEAWAEESRKIRSPQDWLVATLRASGPRGTDGVADRLAPLLRQLRHPLWAPPSPAGFGDATRDWADPDSLLNRAELARTLATRLGRGVGDPRRLLDVVDLAADDPTRALVDDSSIDPAERFALALASPAFQWR